MNHTSQLETLETKYFVFVLAEVNGVYIVSRRNKYGDGKFTRVYNSFGKAINAYNKLTATV